MSLIPLLPFTLCLIGGVLLQGWGVSAIFLLLTIGSAAVALFFRKVYVAILMLTVAVGYLLAYSSQPKPLPSSVWNKEISYSALVEDAAEYEAGTGLILKIDSCNGFKCSPFMVNGFIPSGNPIIVETDRVKFRAVMETFGNMPTLPDCNDYDEMMLRRGVVGRCFIEPDHIVVTGEDGGFISTLRRLSSKVVVIIASSPLSGASKELLSAMLTGDRSLLSLSLRDKFAATGLSHILALSGLHIGILCSILSVMFFPLWVLRLKWLRVILLLTMLWLFAAFTGFSSSVVRAVLMASVYFISLRIERVSSPINSLCFACIVILIINPMSLYDAGFQMSFLAVASILLFAEKLNPVSRRHKWAYLILSYPVVTLAATLSTGILSARYFNILPVYFIAANFVPALILPFFILGGMMYVIALCCGVEIGIVGYIVDILSRAIISWSDLIGSLPFSSVKEVYVTPAMLIAWFALLATLGVWLYTRRKTYAILSIPLLLIFIVTAVFPYRSSSQRELFIVKAGYHTALLLNDGKTLRMVSTAPAHEHEWIAEDLDRRYRGYRIKRGLDSISTLHDGMIGENIAVKGWRVDAGKKRIVIVKGPVTDSQSTPSGKVVYALVSGGYKGTIEEVIEKISPDTILLSPDLNKRRHDNYQSTLQELSFPFISLRDDIFRRGF